MSLSLHLPCVPSGRFGSPTSWLISLSWASGLFREVWSFFPLFSFSSLSLGVSPAKQEALFSCLWSCEFAALPWKHGEHLLVPVSPWKLISKICLLLSPFLALCTHASLTFRCQLFGVTEITTENLTKKNCMDWKLPKAGWSVKWLLFPQFLWILSLILSRLLIAFDFCFFKMVRFLTFHSLSWSIAD